MDEVIGLVGLAGRERQLVKNLSGGQKRRLDLALGVIGDPRLLFLDEPTTGFDPSARRGAWQNIRDLRDAGATILLTTHDMDEAQALADRVAVIAAGRIVAEGTPATLGGRDAAGACIRFDLPADAGPDDLPVRPTSTDGATVTIEVGDPTAALHRLIRWALDRGSTLPGLAVDGRPSRRSTSG